MSDPVQQQSIEDVEKQIGEKSEAQVEADLKAQVNQKIDITVKKLVDKFGPIAQQYENTAKKVAKRFILNLPIIGEGYAAILDFLDTFDAFVDNLEPTLESALLALQLLNLKLHVDKDSGKQNVSIPEGSLEAVEKLLAGTLSDTEKKNLQMVLDKMKKLRDMEKSVTNKVEKTVNSGLTSVEKTVKTSHIPNPYDPFHKLTHLRRKSINICFNRVLVYNNKIYVDYVCDWVPGSVGIELQNKIIHYANMHNPNGNLCLY